MKFLGKFLFVIVRTLIVAAMFAAGILMLRPPLQVPPLVTLEPAGGAAIAERLEDASVNQRSVQFTWTEVNTLIASRMQSARIASNKLIPVKLIRFYAYSSGDSAEFVLERTVFDYPIYSGIRISSDLDPATGRHKLSGFIGRLSMPVSWALMVNPALAQAAELFGREQKILGEARSMQWNAESLEVSFGIP